MPDTPNSDATPSGGEDTAQLEGLNAKITALEGQVKDQAAANEKLQSQMDDELFADGYLKGDQTKQEPASSEDTTPATEIDYDSMTPGQIAKSLVAERDAFRQELAKSTAASNDGFLKAINQLGVEVDLAMAKQAHPDLKKGLEEEGDYKKEFIKIANENPTYNTEQVYKRVAMEQEYQARQDEKAESAKRQRELDAATERDGGVPSSTTKAAELKPGEAENLAWDKHIGSKGLF